MAFTFFGRLATGRMLFVCPKYMWMLSCCCVSLQIINRSNNNKHALTSNPPSNTIGQAKKSLGPRRTTGKFTSPVIQDTTTYRQALTILFDNYICVCLWYRLVFRLSIIGCWFSSPILESQEHWLIIQLK